MLSLKFQIFSDIHNDWKTLERLLSVEADYYVSAGDQVNWGKGLDRCGEIMRARAGKMYVLPGNHESAEQVADFCERFGLQDFHGRQMQVGSWHIAGLGYSSPTPFNTPGEYSEAEMAAHLEPLSSLKPLMLICHAPPYGTKLDRVREGVHAGSRSVKQFIDRHQPEYFFCGHIHEAEGAQTELGITRAWNVGKKGYLLELE